MMPDNNLISEAVFLAEAPLSSPVYAYDAFARAIHLHATSTAFSHAQYRVSIENTGHSVTSSAPATTAIYTYDASAHHSWLSRDPIGVWGGLNILEFTLNNPLFYNDTDGRDVWPSPGGVNDPTGGNYNPTIPDGAVYIPDPRPDPNDLSDSDLAVHGDWHGRIVRTGGAGALDQQDVISVWYAWPRVPYTSCACIKAQVRRRFHGISDPPWNGAGNIYAVPGDIYATPDQPGDSVLGYFPNPKPRTYTFTYELECVEAVIPSLLKVLSTDSRTFRIVGRRIIEITP